MQKLIYWLVAVMLVGIICGCQDEAKKKAEAMSDEELAQVPGMVTTDVSMLISDSGKIRYHVITPVWYTYNLNPSNDYWYFPEGIELNQLNYRKESVSRLLADTAYNFQNKKLWRLVGNVRMSNVRGEKFNTEELFWDMRAEKVYSDSFIHIERNHDILEGYGFTSNQDFSVYEVRQTTGIFEIHQTGEAADFEGEAPDDGEHLAENDEPGTISPTPEDTVPQRPLTPKEKAEAARQRRNRQSSPQQQFSH